MLKLKNIAVGISGGVDSAVAALLLKSKGFNVVGVFLQNWDITDEKGICSIENDYQDAVYISKKLNIILHHKNFVKEYWNEVFCPLVKEYQSGCTPNPDIICNKHIKFNYFYKFAINDLKVDAIATGHYANTSFGPYLEEYDPEIGVKLLLANDRKKDQTFFLSQIPQTSLRKVMFPLGNLTKSEVKHIAVEAGLKKIAEKPESMGICFIGTRDFQDFIQEYVSDKPGDILDIDTSKIVGQHTGLHKWTLGQRARLGGFPTAYYIAKKDVENNTIYVAKGTDHPILYTDLVATSKPHWIHSEHPTLKAGDILQCNFKFQHTQLWDPCEVCKTEHGLVIHLKKPKRAITPGQFAVLSVDNECLGSAKIINSGVSDFSSFYLQTQNVQNNNKAEILSK